MKKQYIIPETLVMNIRFKQTLLDGSPLDRSGDTPTQRDFTSTTDEMGGNLGRGFSGFGDDDE